MPLPTCPTYVSQYTKKPLSEILTSKADLPDTDNFVSTHDANMAALLEAELDAAKKQLATYQQANGGVKPPHFKRDRSDVIATDALVDAVEEAVSSQATGMLCPAASAWSVRQIINRLRLAEKGLNVDDVPEVEA